MSSEAKMQKKNLLIVGLGLLGGSLGMALRAGAWRRLGYARRPETRTRALELDAVDEVGDDLAGLLARADLTVIALPIPATIEFLRTHAKDWRPGAVVTDVGSVKADIVQAAREAFAGSDVRFVGSHPMAGTEKSGIDAAFPTLYDRADVFVTASPGDDPAAAVLVGGLWRSLGAKVVPIDAVVHDALVARSSHVLHILASALTLSVLDVDDPDERRRRFAGCATGFRDTSRIASSNPAMWREIIERNRAAVLAAMRDFDLCYERFRTLVIEGRFDEFEAEFAAGKRLRDEWLEYKKGK